MGQRIPVISLLLPTRQRPQELRRLYDSVMATADKPEEIEIVVYIDNDDDSYDDFNPPKDWPVKLVKVRGERDFNGETNLSVMWNKCWGKAKGDYFMHCGDDIVFRTKGWDTAVKEAIDARPKKIAFVWCNDYSDESHRNEFGTHGFVHRNWTDVVGRFVPPYFASDYNDTWFNDVAGKLGVTTYLHQFITEHMHYSLGKAKIDKNTEERLARHERQHPEGIYNSRQKRVERADEVEKLRQFIG